MAIDFETRDLLPEGMRDTRFGREFLHLIDIQLADLSAIYGDRLRSVLEGTLDECWSELSVGFVTTRALLTDQFEKDASDAYYDKLIDETRPTHRLYLEALAAHPDPNDHDARVVMRRRTIGDYIAGLPEAERTALAEARGEDLNRRNELAVLARLGIELKSLISDEWKPMPKPDAPDPGGHRTNPLRHAVDEGHRPSPIDEDARAQTGFPRREGRARPKRKKGGRGRRKK